MHLSMKKTSFSLLLIICLIISACTGSIPESTVSIPEPPEITEKLEKFQFIDSSQSLSLTFRNDTLIRQSFVFCNGLYVDFCELVSFSFVEKIESGDIYDFRSCYYEDSIYRCVINKKHGTVSFRMLSDYVFIESGTEILFKRSDSAPSGKK